MGSAVCKPTDEAIRQNQKIDNELRKDEKEQQKKIKFLLLGISDAGKSTIVKQMRQIHDGGFNDTEIINAIFQIRQNIIEAFKQVSILILKNGSKIAENEKAVLNVFAYETSKVEMMNETDELTYLNDFRFFECIMDFFRTNKCHPMVPDNIFYFFPELHRILVTNYVPTIQDMIHMRATTLGVHEISFDFRKHVIRLIDVGGQKTERRKWIHFFEGVTAVMFVTSLSCFDQFVLDDTARTEIEEEGKATDSSNPVVLVSWETSLNRIENRVLIRSASSDASKLLNRLQDSVELFKSVLKNNFLHRSCFMLFLNKKDVLEHKLKALKFIDYFPDYSKYLIPDNQFNTVTSYIDNMFRKGAGGNQKIYSHYTQATDTKSIDYVFNSACDVIFQQYLDNVELE
ncbi:unnamed protein product [Caenorhabditis angaria]|uniref:Uncharacterized protein n=1 Tax=Caenorhabditis angaria TaxID=860376 RepID=A0A9P1NAS1_9PELO|nr:unnamed protein product [Caenorhabditis angaria]